MLIIWRYEIHGHYGNGMEWVTKSPSVLEKGIENLWMGNIEIYDAIDFTLFGTLLVYVRSRSFSNCWICAIVINKSNFYLLHGQENGIESQMATLSKLFKAERVSAVQTWVWCSCEKEQGSQVSPLRPGFLLLFYKKQQRTCIVLAFNNAQL